MKSYKITALAENTTFRHNCIAQHGQSLLIETDNYRLLFDVGEIPHAVSHNLEHLGIAVDAINDVVISHRHIDHIGALLPMIPLMKEQRLFLPLQLGESHIKQHPEKYNFLKPNVDGGYDIAISREDALKINKYQHIRVVETNGFQLTDDMYTTGCIGDWMMEQAIVIDQHDLGLVLLLGCSHPGVEALIEKAKEVTGNSRVRVVIGGMHYTDYSAEEMATKAQGLLDSGVEFVVPSHCTTIAGARALKKTFGENCLLSKTGTLGTGNSIEISDKIKTNFV